MLRVEADVEVSIEVDVSKLLIDDTQQK